MFYVYRKVTNLLTLVKSNSWDTFQDTWKSVNNILFTLRQIHETKVFFNVKCIVGTRTYMDMEILKTSRHEKYHYKSKYTWALPKFIIPFCFLYTCRIIWGICFSLSLLFRFWYIHPFWRNKWARFYYFRQWSKHDRSRIMLQSVFLLFCNEKG